MDASSSSAPRRGPAGATSATRAPAESSGGSRIARNVESALVGAMGGACGAMRTARVRELAGLRSVCRACKQMAPVMPLTCPTFERTSESHRPARLDPPCSWRTSTWTTEQNSGTSNQGGNGRLVGSLGLLTAGRSAVGPVRGSRAVRPVRAVGQSRASSRQRAVRAVGQSGQSGQSGSPGSPAVRQSGQSGQSGRSDSRGSSGQSGGLRDNASPGKGPAAVAARRAAECARPRARMSWTAT
jgi:hypothetical protein